ncbi:MAG: maleylpyruvate isomerase family mycothiol-dependent enzyme [Pseudonocardia sp.]|nr:maleylpyruvate isomerase family mycothiol-dependent enzyme [Pseudonocardia sp.]
MSAPGSVPAHLTAENDRLASALAAAEPSTPVPTCPGWDLRSVLKHVGRGDRWAAQMVAGRATEVLPPRDVVGGRPPEGGADAEADWLRGGVRELFEAVESVGADTPIWTFTGPKPAAWWIRRRLHESTVHRADVTLALGRTFDLAPDLAADGVSEWLDLVAARPASEDGPLAAGATLHLHATDDALGAAGEWLLHGEAADDGSAVAWEHGHGKGDAAVRGTASDLLLAVSRRIPADDARLQVLGAAAVWTRWLDHTKF